MELTDKKILVTGGAGFLGSFVVDALRARGIPEENITVPRSADTDLRIKENCEQVVQGQDIVIHLAAKVGGIGFNRKKPGEIFYDNIMIGTQMMEAARNAGVKKFVALGTVCSYPKFTPVPFKEDDIWNGYPEETNAPYGLAKKMLLVQGQAYREQYGFNVINLLPVNLYGPRDNFHPDHSHVIPATIRKIDEAKDKKQDYIDVWGTGSASREFLYVADAADAIVRATELYEGDAPVNIGSGQEILIKNLVELLGTIMEFTGEIRWDSTKPDGQPYRGLDVSRAKKEFGFTAQTSFEEGLKNAIDWYYKKIKTA